MMDCKQTLYTQEQFWEYLDDSLDFQTRVRIDEHLKKCSECQDAFHNAGYALSLYRSCSKEEFDDIRFSKALKAATRKKTSFFNRHSMMVRYSVVAAFFVGMVLLSLPAYMIDSGGEASDSTWVKYDQYLAELIEPQNTFFESLEDNSIDKFFNDLKNEMDLFENDTNF